MDPAAGEEHLRFLAFGMSGAHQLDDVVEVAVRAHQNAQCVSHGRIPSLLESQSTTALILSKISSRASL